MRARCVAALAGLLIAPACSPPPESVFDGFGPDGGGDFANLVVTLAK